PGPERRRQLAQHDAVVRGQDRPLLRIDRREAVDHLAVAVGERAADRVRGELDRALQDHREWRHGAPRSSSWSASGARSILTWRSRARPLTHVSKYSAATVGKSCCAISGSLGSRRGSMPVHAITSQPNAVRIGCDAARPTSGIANIASLYAGSPRYRGVSGT